MIFSLNVILKMMQCANRYNVIMMMMTMMMMIVMMMVKKLSYNTTLNQTLAIVYNIPDMLVSVKSVCLELHDE